MRSLLVTREVPEAKAPLKYFHRWMKLSKPNEFDKPTKQELTVATLSVLLAPLVIAGASIWIFFQPEFLDLRPFKRVLFALAIPFLLPAAYCYVVFVDVLRPLIRRVRLRFQMLRKAKRAVRDLWASLR